MEVDLPRSPPHVPGVGASALSDGDGDDVADIDEDLPCARCQYNLRGLRGDGRCPECGLTVRATLRRNVVLSQTDLHWLDTLRRGAYLLAAATVAWVVAPFTVVQSHMHGHVAAPLVLAGPRVWTLPFAWGTRMPLPDRPLLLLAALAALLLYALGVWHVASQEPSLKHTERGLTQRRALLALAAVLLLAPYGWWLGWRDATGWWEWALFRRGGWFVWAGAFALLDLAVHVLLFAHLGRLASRVLDDALVRETRALARAQTVGLACIAAGSLLGAAGERYYVAVAALACLLMSLAGIGVTILMFAFVRAFGQSAVAARAGEQTPYALAAAADAPDMPDMPDE